MRVKTTVTRFHTAPIVGTRYSFRIVPMDEQKGGIEFSLYSAEIARHLSALGWSLSDKPDSKPDMFVYFSYGIDKGETVSGSVPVYGQTGGGNAYTYGTVTTGGGTSTSFSGNVYSTPTYGMVGSMPYSSRLYSRSLKMDIFDANASTPQKPVKLFEGRVSSVGTKSDISEVLPTMIEALFRNFPGPNGKPERIVLPIQGLAQVH